MNSKERALLLSTLTTAFGLLPTIYAAVVSNSVVLLADLIRCSVEFLAILCSYLVLRCIGGSSRRAFPYGIGKIERLVSMGIAAAMVLGSLVLITIAVHRLLFPELIVNAGFGLLLSSLSVVGNAVMWGYNSRVNSAQFSPVIDAQAKLFRAKFVAALIVFIALVFNESNLTTAWAEYADPIGSLIMAAFLLYSASGIFLSSLHDLMDRAVEDVYQLKLLKILIKHEALYSNLGEIRTRQSGGVLFAELNLFFEPQLTLADVQMRIGKIKSDFEVELPWGEVTVVPRPRP